MSKKEPRVVDVSVPVTDWTRPRTRATLAEALEKKVTPAEVPTVGAEPDTKNVSSVASLPQDGSPPSLLPAAPRSPPSVPAVPRVTVTDQWLAHGGVVLDGSVKSLMELAEYIHKSGLAKKGLGPNAIGAIIQFGAELGLRPMTALQVIGWIGNEKGGNLVAYGTGLIALASRHALWEGMEESLTGSWEDWTRTATVTVKRKGCPPCTKSFTAMDANVAGLLSKETWQKYPDRMLLWKPRNYAIRDQFADAILGLMSEEEALDIYGA